MASTFYSDIQIAKPVEVFGLIRAHKEDPHPDKINLAIGAYKTDEGKPWVMPVVRKVEGQLLEADLDKVYLPIAGHQPFIEEACKLVLGANSPVLKEERVTSFHTPGGTTSLRLAAEVISKLLQLKVAYVGTPGWVNHVGLFTEAGIEVREFNYWDEANKSLDWNAFKHALCTAPGGSVFIMQVCSHNPTGVDPTQEQWKEVASIMKERHLFPLFDNAYQGLVSGDLDVDPWAVRYFVDQGFEMMITQTFSKNFCVYNDRVGHTAMVMKDGSQIAPLNSQVELIIRRMYSNPPAHGGRVVSTILKDRSLTAEWKVQVKSMSQRIIDMRRMLYNKLKALGTPGSWEHILTQKGMFCFTGIDNDSVESLRKEYHIYIMSNGRITICGLTSKNMDYVANAFHDVLTRKK